MRLRGIHAQGVITLEDALAKLGAGKMTPDDFLQLEALMRQHQSSMMQGALTPEVVVLPPLPSGAR